MVGVVLGVQALWLCNDFQTIHTLKTNSQLLRSTTCNGAVSAFSRSIVLCTSVRACMCAFM